MSALGENAFPKISGKRQDFVASLRSLADAVGLPPILDIEGTVKLHGMHADMVFDLESIAMTAPCVRSATEDSLMTATELDYADNTIKPVPVKHPLTVTFQSRNRIRDPKDSQHGWPCNIAKLPDALIYLRDRILTRYHSKNPYRPLNTTHPLIVAGEWIGPKVQQDVGVSQLSHRFVILSIQINGAWQHDADYGDIEATIAGIYSIFRAGKRTVQFNTNDLSDRNPALLEMQNIADVVEISCPFAAAFGIPNSRGEGVVWKPALPAARANAKYWIKTKGPIYGPENRITVTKITSDAERKATIDEICKRFVTPRRVEQGFEYLIEMGLTPDRVSVKIFAQWIVTDVWTEEKGEIEEMEKGREGVRAVLRKKVKWLARCAFIEEMGKCGASIAWLD